MNTVLNRIKKIISKDKRKGERLHPKITAYYSRPEENKWLGPVILRDISGGGLKFNSSRRIKKDTELNLKIELPGDPKPILVKGRISWSKKASKPGASKIAYHTGLQFCKMDYKSRQKFVTFICTNILSGYLNKKIKISRQ